jgi:hypothetical protein
MSQFDLDVLEGQINDYKRTDELFNQGIALKMLDSLEIIKDKVLPQDEELYGKVVNKMKAIAFPPAPIVPIPPPLNPADISPLLNEIIIL